MSSESSAARSIIDLGMVLHKDSITIAVLPQNAKTPTRLERLLNDLAKLKRVLDRLARDDELRVCYEASGAGYVLHRALRDWGYTCEVIAPSLIPKRAGVQRKPDKRDACELARLYRAGELTPVRIPSEAEERGRDVVRCRETFQREILKSLRWFEHLASEQSPLVPADRLVFGEYHALLALLAYTRQRRDELDRQIEQLALRIGPALPRKRLVGTGFSLDAPANSLERGEHTTRAREGQSAMNGQR